MVKGLVIVIFLFWLTGCTAAGTSEVAFSPTSTRAVIETTTMAAEIKRTSTPLPAVDPTQTATAPTQRVTMTPDPINDPILNTQLLQAAETGNTPVVRQLIEQGANINAQDDRGRTPVMAATHGNHVETIQALIEAGADVNIRDHRLDNPFLYAGAEGQLDILRLMIDARADTRLTNRFGGTALIPAAERGHVEIVKELLTRTDVDVNHINNLGWTALLEAIILGQGGDRHTEVVRLLVEAGADVNLADSNGVTPLEHAQQRGFANIEQILRIAGAR